MVDLETLSTRPDAEIIQIGAVMFDPMDPLALEEQYQEWAHLSGEMRHIDHSTLAWWLSDDSGPGKKIAMKRECPPLRIVLQGFANFVKDMRPRFIWSHGAAFDIAILHHAFAQMNIEIPWHYRATRDTRTLYDLAGGTPEPLVKGIPHLAVDDARAQATQVQQAFLRLRNALAEVSTTPVAALPQGGPGKTLAEAVGLRGD
jgi:exodeoxyribonuclease VIII